MVMRYLGLLLFLTLPLQACEKDLPGYGETLVVDEGDTRWNVTLHKSRHNLKGSLVVQLEYINEKGDSFSVQPQNVVITDDEGNRWASSSHFPHIKLLTPGNSKTVPVVFADIPITKNRPLYLHPFHDLAVSDPGILLKAAGGDPVPGHHTTPDWTQAE